MEALFTLLAGIFGSLTLVFAVLLKGPKDWKIIVLGICLLLALSFAVVAGSKTQSELSCKSYTIENTIEQTIVNGVVVHSDTTYLIKVVK